MDSTCSALVELLARLVRVPTPNDPSQGVKPGLGEAEAIREAIEQATGSSFEVLEGPSPVIVAVRGEGRPVSLFLAHYDVVPPGPGWSVDPWSGIVRDGRLYGRGAADDKSNVAAISMALAGYHPSRGTIVVAFTGDEETGGRSAAWLAEWLRREGLWPDYLVNGDGSLSRIITRRRNAFSATVRVRADRVPARGEPFEKRFETRFLVRKTMHSAYLVPGVDTHALVAASLWARDHDALVSKLEGEWVKRNVVPRSTRLLGVLQGGEGEERVVDEGLTQLVRAVVPLVRAPAEAEEYSDYGVTINPNTYAFRDGVHELGLDIRAMSLSPDRIKEALEYVLENNLGPGGFELWMSSGGGYLYTPRTARIVREAARVQGSLGLNPEPIEAGGASDSRHFSPHGVEAIDYGPLGYNIHGPDEHVLVEHLCLAPRFYRMLAEALHR